MRRFFYGSYILVKTLVFGVNTPGYASLMTVVLFLGGVQLISIGVIGEYMGRLVTETKRRPIYIANVRISEGKVTLIDEFV